MDRYDISSYVINGRRRVYGAGKHHLRCSPRIGQTKPLPHSTKVVEIDYSHTCPVYQILLQNGCLYTSLTNRSHAEIKRILDGLYAFGKNVDMDTIPLLYLSNRYMYVMLAKHQLWNGLQWNELHLGNDTHLPEICLAYRNEYRQYFYCTVADNVSFEGSSCRFPFIKLDNLTQTHLSEGFGDLSINESHYPGSGNFDQPPFESSPVQATDDVENEMAAVEPNCVHQSISEDIGHGNNTKWMTAKYPHYADAGTRFGTYRGWPLAEPNSNTLCSVGFFFTGHSYDLVRCFCCGIGLKDFSETDNPLLEHAKHSSNCPFIIDYFGSRAALEAYKLRFATQTPEEIRLRQRELYEQQQGRPVTIYRAKHERFRTLESRLETFTHWPQHLSQRPNELADAGMYYTGVDDHCRCFACDGGLRNWEPGDDPWIEHCRWFPACNYAREVKGDEFINLVQQSADQAVEENRRDEVNGARAAVTIDDSNVQRIIDKHRTVLIQDMGFPLNDVKTAVLELVQQATTDPDIDDIITRLEVINEKAARRPIPAHSRTTRTRNIIATKPTT